MRVLLAFDKFKDALSAEQACRTADDALRSIHPDWEVDLCPFTDGGDGFARILTAGAQGDLFDVEVAGPRGSPVIATVGLVQTSALAAAPLARLDLPTDLPRNSCLGVIDMASASGLGLLSCAGRDPWLASSFGTGQLIRAAQHRGCTTVLLGVGGSATNDLGLGALSALGLEFLDAAGAAVPVPTPDTWDRIDRLRGAMPVDLPAIRMACDVANPLLGAEGCTASFGPQKGLRATDLARMEAACARMARMLCAHFRQPDTLTTAPGGGAAGGIAFGLQVATGAVLLPGAELVAEWLALDQRILQADIVLTGEGRFDRGSRQGKGPGAILARAAALDREAHVFAGSVAADSAAARLHAVTPPELPLAEALPRTAELLRAAVLREFSGRGSGTHDSPSTVAPPTAE